MMPNHEEYDIYAEVRQRFTKRHSSFRQYHAKYLTFYDTVSNTLIKKYNLKYKSSFYLLSAVALFIDSDLNRSFSLKDMQFMTHRPKEAVRGGISQLTSSGLIEFVRIAYDSKYVITERGIRMLRDFTTMMNDFELKREIKIHDNTILPLEKHHKIGKTIYVPTSARGKGSTFFSRGVIKHIVHGDNKEKTAAVIFVMLAGKEDSFPYYPKDVKPVNWPKLQKEAQAQKKIDKNQVVEEVPKIEDKAETFNDRLRRELYE